MSSATGMYARLKAQRLCVQCHLAPAARRRVRCAACLVQDAARKQQRRLQWIRAGRCHSCGGARDPHETSYDDCQKCRERKAARTQRRLREGRCKECEAPPLKHGGLCARHLQQQASRLQRRQELEAYYVYRWWPAALAWISTLRR